MLNKELRKLEEERDGMAEAYGTCAWPEILGALGSRQGRLDVENFWGRGISTYPKNTTPGLPITTSRTGLYCRSQYTSVTMTRGPAGCADLKMERRCQVLAFAVVLSSHMQERTKESDPSVALQEIQETQTVAEVAFTGDTTIDFLKGTSPSTQLALTAKLLIMELTFLDDTVTVEKARV